MYTLQRRSSGQRYRSFLPFYLIMIRRTAERKGARVRNKQVESTIQMLEAYTFFRDHSSAHGSHFRSSRYPAVLCRLGSNRPARHNIELNCPADLRPPASVYRDCSATSGCHFRGQLQRLVMHFGFLGIPRPFREDCILILRAASMQS